MGNTPSGNLHLNQHLSNLSLKYNNGSLISDLLFPRLSVVKESDKYFIYGQQDKNLPDAARADGAPANEVLSWAVTDGVYACTEWALKDKVTQRMLDNADVPVKPDIEATNGLTAMLSLLREKRVADLCNFAAFATSGHRLALTTTQQWNHASYDSDSPVDAIEARIDVAKETIRKATGMEPNTLILPAAVAKVVKRDASIRELIKYTQNGLLTNGDLPPTMFNMKVLIPGAVSNSANLGQTYVGADVWGKRVILAYIAPGVTLRAPTFGLTLEARARRTKKWWDDNIDANWIQVDEVVCEKVVSEYCGYILDDVIA